MSDIEKNLGRQEFRYSKDPTSLTKFLKTMLWISWGVSFISLLSDSAQWILLRSGTFSQAEAEANDTRQLIVGVLYFVTFVVTTIAFMIWVYRANLNCHGFGAQGMRFTPGWSIAYYFIPIFCLYKPYQAMKEIWKVSTNPSNWQNEKGSPLLGWWWALWLISGPFNPRHWLLPVEADTINSLRLLTSLLIISDGINMLLYIFTISLISEISTKQEALVRENA
uniref:DUF4328 domain-containing protein n=1 Tax=Dictyoglomus turgidum TaxID=513050 RepID=A0A7C3SR65_9BACT